ncbi:MAG: hypothetical protein DI598_08760 [Pseudopedobacter saltans]|uniref:CHAT domain-containing protein n=1 Tax=Pseudopedobacter saltans TaxID=151895 RepID=A0A2W5EYJ4_9SPHI|nr:MAG: hypothetical protein DI598_08760 [Pseudopedobacter saltans]
MANMKYLYFLSIILFTLTYNTTQAQTTDIPQSRIFFHDKIDKLQKRIFLLDNKEDTLFTPYVDNDGLNAIANHAATVSIDSFQTAIEKNNNWDGNVKIKFLRGFGDALQLYAAAFTDKRIKGAQLQGMVNSYAQAAELESEGLPITPAIDRSSLEVGGLLIDNFAFKDNQGIADCKQLLIGKECQKYPTQALEILNRHPEYKKADSIIIDFAHRNPDVLYDYASSTSRISNTIRNNKDLLVRVISQMANPSKKNGRQYFPFLDNLYKGKITFEEIDKTLDDPTKVSYYRLLVKTEIEYAERVLKERDTPMGMNALGTRLKAIAIDPFVNSINGLHESPDAIRFKDLTPLNPEELYYLAVLSEDELYTSSYLKGVYPQIFQKGGKGFGGEQILTNVYFDHFKKWIKMAANYNKLEDFLNTMKPENADELMRHFVRDLDKGKGKDSLEDAVDVAGSFASIKNDKIRNLVLEEVQANLKHAQVTNNKKATAIYDILNILFLSMDPKNNIDVSKALGIEPVYYMPIKNLENTKNVVNIQQYFYGDKDGQAGYSNFISSFSSMGWKVENKPKWSVVYSTKGATTVKIYSNKPLDEQQGLDDDAQKELNGYLAENDIEPTIVIHRGHSYYLSSTIKQLVPSAKVVMLGSCGGFQSLSQVLSIAPEAHIISSRQTGTGLVNLSLISGMLNTLRDGKNLNWVEMWKGFSKKLNGNAEFADYVPPYNNLGAVFLMAYQKLQENEEKNNAIAD